MRTVHRDIVAALIISADDKLLIGQPASGAGVYSGTWLIPGGGIEAGETMLEALRREILEETTLDVADYEVKFIEDTATGRSEKILKETGERVMVEMKFIDYEVRTKKLAADCNARPGDDLVVLDWVALDDLGTTNLSPPTIELLKRQGYLGDR